MYFLVYRDAQLQWRWTLFAANHRRIGNAGEGYYNKSDCVHAISLVKSCANVPIYEDQKARGMLG